MLATTLEAAGTSLARVVEDTICLTDMTDFPAIRHGMPGFTTS